MAYKYLLFLLLAASVSCKATGPLARFVNEDSEQNQVILKNCLETFYSPIDLINKISQQESKKKFLKMFKHLIYTSESFIAEEIVQEDDIKEVIQKAINKMGNEEKKFKNKEKTLLYLKHLKKLIIKYANALKYSITCLENSHYKKI